MNDAVIKGIQNKIFNMTAAVTAYLKRNTISELLLPSECLETAEQVLLDDNRKYVKTTFMNQDINVPIQQLVTPRLTVDFEQIDDQKDMFAEITSIFARGFAETWDRQLLFQLEDNIYKKIARREQKIMRDDYAELMKTNTNKLSMLIPAQMLDCMLGWISLTNGTALTNTPYDASSATSHHVIASADPYLASRVFAISRDEPLGVSYMSTPTIEMEIRFRSVSWEAQIMVARAIELEGKVICSDIARAVPTES